MGEKPEVVRRGSDVVTVDNAGEVVVRGVVELQCTVCLSTVHVALQTA